MRKGLTALPCPQNDNQLEGLTIGLGFLSLIGGTLFSWISSWFLYGFGELIETNAQIAKNTAMNNRTHPLINSQMSGTTRQTAPPKAKLEWNCKKCGKQNYGEETVCFSCKTHKHSPVSSPVPRVKNQTGWTCPKCKSNNSNTEIFCNECGENK